MPSEQAGIIGGIAANRPHLTSLMLAVGACALAAVGYTPTSAPYGVAAIAAILSFTIVVLAPTLLAAATPANFWIRALIAASAAGMLLGARRVVLQDGLASPVLPDAPLALGVAAATSFAFVLGAQHWRGIAARGLVGVAATTLSTTAAIGLFALSDELTLQPLVGPTIALAAAISVILCLQIAADFSARFVEGEANRRAAGLTARDAAPIALASGVIALAALAPLAGGSLDALAVAAGALAVQIAAALFFTTGALAVKRHNENVAVDENRRRAALRPLLELVRRTLPPSSAIAAVAVAVIIAVIAAFEVSVAISVGEVGVVVVAALVGGVSLVSLRTPVFVGALLTLSHLVTMRVSLAVAPAPEARAVGLAIAAVLATHLAFAWRDARDPRRTARDTARLALRRQWFAHLAGATLGAASLAAMEAAGLWQDGVEAALYAAMLAAIMFLLAPPLMISLGAAFGRSR